MFIGPGNPDLTLKRHETLLVSLTENERQNLEDAFLKMYGYKIVRKLQYVCWSLLLT